MESSDYRVDKIALIEQVQQQALQKIEEVETAINLQANLNTQNQKEVDRLTLELEDTGLSSFQRRDDEIVKAGLESKIKTSINLIGEYTTDVFNPTIKGQLQNQLQYLYVLRDFANTYYYKQTLISYEPWHLGALDVDGSMVVGNWTYSGTAASTKALNTQSDYDIIAKVTGIAGANSEIRSLVPLEANKKYRISCLLKPQGNMTTGNVVISLNTTVPATATISNTNLAANVNKWIGVEFYVSGDQVSNFFTFPEYVAATGTTFVNKDITVSQNYTVSFKYTGTNSSGNVLFYRPRLEEVSGFMPTVDEMYMLYDNPIMYGFTPGNIITLENIEGLYDLLYNYNYVNNITKKKDIIINSFYKDYEEYIYEGYYDNSEELDSNGLLEQALVAFDIAKYPILTYGTTVIDMSAIQGFEFLKINVGDNILIQEDSDRLYKTYKGETTKYLQISQISFNLRQPESTTLTIAQDDETKNLLQRIIQLLN